VQADIDRFAPLRTRLDDAIINEDLTAPFAIYNLYQQRFDERMAYARELLKTKFDFAADESYQIDREKAAWSTNNEQHFAMRMAGDTKRLVIDNEGLYLVMVKE